MADSEAYVIFWLWIFYAALGGENNSKEWHQQKYCSKHLHTYIHISPLVHLVITSLSFLR